MADIQTRLLGEHQFKVQRLADPGGSGTLNLRPTGPTGPAELTALTRSASPASSVACESDGARHGTSAVRCRVRNRTATRPRSVPSPIESASRAPCGANLARTALFRAWTRDGSLRMLKLLVQVVHVLLPEARLAKPRKGPRKSRVQPALRDPGGMVEHARGPQHLHESDLRHARSWQIARSRPAIRPTGGLVRPDCRPETSTDPGSPDRSRNRRDRRTPGPAPARGCCRGGSPRAAGSAANRRCRAASIFASSSTLTRAYRSRMCSGSCPEESTTSRARAPRRSARIAGRSAKGRRPPMAWMRPSVRPSSSRAPD